MNIDSKASKTQKHFAYGDGPSKQGGPQARLHIFFFSNNGTVETPRKNSKPWSVFSRKKAQALHIPKSDPFIFFLFFFFQKK
jgi:hypothetical protein